MSKLATTIRPLLSPRSHPSKSICAQSAALCDTRQLSTWRPLSTSYLSSSRSPYLSRPVTRWQQKPSLSRFSQRNNSSLVAPDSESSDPPEDLQPAYQITFTCKPCKTRSSHRITKQGYHKGTVLIKCPGCQSRHVIADHLKVFLDQKSTLGDILQKRTADGTPLTDLIKKGKLGIRQGSMVGNAGEEDVEFWEDGTESAHQKPTERQ